MQKLWYGQNLRRHLVSFFAAMEAQGRSIVENANEKTLIIPFSQNEIQIAGQIARKLRVQDRIVVSAVPPYGLKKQLTLANRIGANTVIIIAPGELAKGMMIEKNMSTGEQKIVPTPV